METTVKVEGEGKKAKLVITIPIQEADSKSGKTRVIASTRGSLDTGVQYKGKNIILGLNAYSYKNEKKSKGSDEEDDD